MLEELVAFAKFTQLSILRPRDTGFPALFDAFFTEPVLECADVDSEVSRDLRECHFRAASQRDPDDVVAELFGVAGGHSLSLPSQPKLDMLNVT